MEAITQDGDSDHSLQILAIQYAVRNDKKLQTLAISWNILP